MFFMSTSTVLCQHLMLDKKRVSGNCVSYCNASSVQLSCRRRRCGGVVPYARKSQGKRRNWWWRFFFDEDGNWLGLKDDAMLDAVESERGSGDDDSSENEKFEAWKRRVEAMVELREAQEEVKNEENRKWEDWLVDANSDDVGNGGSWFENSNGAVGRPGNDVGEAFIELRSERGLIKSVGDLVLGREDDDILYEDQVFRYASLKSAKFLAVLVILPWTLDFLVHDYVLVPFLDRYVKTVPLAAQMLDVRKNQKLEMVRALNTEKARYRLEVEIGKSPPLSDEELFLELRNKAIELRDEWRLENRKAFANIWSDMVFGVTLFILLYFYQNQVALLKFTGYKLVNNVSDTGKAFLIILITDIFLGYHSESGWQTLLEIIVEHYGFEVDQAAITIFVCLVPVIIDACVKLWVCLLSVLILRDLQRFAHLTTHIVLQMFKFLPRLSPKVANIFQEMKRH
ncbi:proton extrusion protein PcxA-like isoform X1 [Sesamum indicum]|uniref:Proton extrusion protein PcxA-like isoform X1 n=2 Tax=Sesamum indicum TaxID=4182 RepID=A0A6I9T583_SESIN|nr:proton extrusion protein PcxA-like isoform X1 [Sesamum indicum]XP_020549311.1 proton extrusion protein PcxA-like isoform X1 [Sesamum indicum]